MGGGGDGIRAAAELQRQCVDAIEAEKMRRMVTKRAQYRFSSRRTRGYIIRHRRCWGSSTATRLRRVSSTSSARAEDSSAGSSPSRSFLDSEINPKPAR